MHYNTELWTKILELGRKEEPAINGDVANKLDRDDITTIIASMDFFNATEIWKQQTWVDLNEPFKYRIYDWLAMNVMSRNDDNRQQNETALKVLVYSYLKAKGNVKAFIKDLRETDYQVNESWEEIKIEE